MDLKTNYMGLELKNPLIASAGPFSAKKGNIKRLQDAGAAGVVMFSLFEEQIKHDEQSMEHFMAMGTDSFTESQSFFPHIDDYTVGRNQYLDMLEEAVDAVDIPIFGSLNGITNSGWIDWAVKMEKAGAAGIELNIYYIPVDLNRSGSEVEAEYVEILKAVKAAVNVPVALKLNPYFSSTGNMAKQLDDAGADALVLFNRFYQPDFDLKTLEVQPNLLLSTAAEMRLPLRWIAILHNQVKASLAATTGVETSDEVIKYILAGADTVMTTCALLRHGVEYMGDLLSGLTSWMEEKEYESVSQMRGAMSQAKVGDSQAFLRANYIKVIESYKSDYIAM